MSTTVHMTPFEVEQWMDKYQPGAKYDLGETCAASVSVEDLKEISDDKSGNIVKLSKKLTYGEIRGSQELRSNLAGLYSVRTPNPLPSENILITPGAIAANFLVLYTLIKKGDHVICHHPTYQQLYEVPASFGAEVSLWRADEQKKWKLDIEELKGLLRPTTKLIIINNPNNPTGQIIPKSQLLEIVEFCREHDLILMSDEVYRPLFHSISPADPEFPPSVMSMGYSKTITTGSLSKAYSLAGIRVGWIASRSRDIIESLASGRDYTNISVSQIDDQIATYALSRNCIHNLLSRNIKLAKSNLDMLEQFVDQHRWSCHWSRPIAGTTAFVKFMKEGRAINDVEFCKLLIEQKGVLFCPGSLCFGGSKEFKGYVRIGFVGEADTVKQGLSHLTAFMQDSFVQVSLAT